MKNSNFKLVPVALLTAALVAACGGRTDVAPVSGVPVPGDLAINVASVVGYVDQLVATDENSVPVDIDGLTLAADETTESSTSVVF